MVTYPGACPIAGGLLFWFRIALCAALGAGVLIYALLRSELGLALMAMRDNESAAETIGIGLS